MNIQKKKKIALVLSGGGIKAAAYHIGVCLALKEKGFVFAGGPKELVRQKFVEAKIPNLPSAPTIRLYVGSSAARRLPHAQIKWWSAKKKFGFRLLRVRNVH